MSGRRQLGVSTHLGDVSALKGLADAQRLQRLAEAGGKLDLEPAGMEGKEGRWLHCERARMHGSAEPTWGHHCATKAAALAATHVCFLPRGPSTR